MRARFSPAWLLGLLVAALWLWDLGALGLASRTEIPILARAQSWLGADPGGWSPAPQFPDWVRALFLSLDSSPFATSALGHLLAKLPTLLCALALMGLAWSWGKAQKLSGLGCMAVLAALPLTSIAARHLTPDLWGELAFSTLIWSRHCRPFGPRRRLLIELVAFAMLLHCAGLWWGLSVAAALLWLHEGHRGWGFLALLCALASLGLTLELGDGYSPWLASARGPSTLHEGLPQPFTRALMGILSDFGLWAPWVGFAWLSADSSRALERRWLALVWGSQVLSSVAFAPGPILGLLPASILLVHCATHERLSLPSLCITSAIAWGLLLRTLPQFPSQLAWPHTLVPELAPGAGQMQAVWQAQAGIMLAMLGALGVARRPNPWLLAGLLLSVALQAQLGARALSTNSSIKALATPLRPLDREGTKIASYGVEDPGWRLYAESSWPRLASMQAATEHLDQSSPAALVLSKQSAKQLAGQLSHVQDPLLQVLTDVPHHIVLVNQAAASQAAATHPFRSFERLRTIPPLGHQCRVVFDDALELVGWQLTGPLRRGRASEFQAVFRVLKPLRGPHRIVVQLRGKPFSPWPSFHSPSSTDDFPISAWQAGDLIFFTKPLEVPWLLTSSGPLELSIGLAKSEYSYKPITFPEKDPPKESGLRWLGKKHRRIILGKVERVGLFD